MAIPASAKKFDGVMDPYDLVEYQADCGGDSGLLESGETIDTWSLTCGAEAVALGVAIKTGGLYAAGKVNANTSILFWLEVASLNQEDVVFAAGVLVPLTLSITTNATPPRRRQRTLVVEVKQQ